MWLLIAMLYFIGELDLAKCCKGCIWNKDKSPFVSIRISEMDCKVHIFSNLLHFIAHIYTYSA